MQRLVYSPKSYAFIRGMDNQVYDVSPYITGGNVTRKINQVSTATLKLRNPQMMFTIPNTPVFHPMDAITIFLERVKDFPVRVFTGFLDRTPYIELFPGEVELRASCTLKKLLYTYFDPALPYTRQFMLNYGWVDQGNGSIISNAAFNDTATTGKNKGDPRIKVDPLIQGKKSGSISDLLFATLQHIGGWTPDDIAIEALPEDLMTRIATLYQRFDAENDKAKDEFTTFMKNIIGSGAQGISGQLQAGASDSQSAKLGPPGSGQTITASFYGATASDEGGAPGCGGQNGVPKISRGYQYNGGIVFAELQNGKSLGGLPCNTQLRITYGSHSIVAKKVDTGGADRGIDLYYKTWDALGIPRSKGVVQVKVERV